ncbi:GNAT family N-acetyltransferase [Panacibacter ginsenosidivorans]|uniref:GNAT family N-acetyltransferase n=1 Tax=Panacibacter ginsenosidivorans TaxID=1813871 RepID=A0A5B8V7X6_9BACT|nr:GNAT family N-acetyltransferase [Panacibacter ginsenosidivorans]QEC67339.1 GNAT family N-acetyltransferase [Panacibacter ginsenosidivorans]
MKAHEHIKFNGALLDNFLAQGCYRMRQDIFTTNLIWDKGNIYHVFWLRYPLADFYFDNKPQKLLTANSFFEIGNRDFFIHTEIEELYKLYLDKVNFDAPPTMQDFLFGEAFTAGFHHNLFDSAIIEIRDGAKLIAAGIYDKGSEAIAGIMNFYDPAYRKYSLGKYLMLLKMQYAIENQLQFYYPGYIAYGYNKFDYKLFPNPHLAQIFDVKKKVWLPYSKQLLAQLVDEFEE